MRNRIPLWAVAGLALTLAGIVLAQGYQPNFIRNLLSPIITGGATVSGMLTADTIRANVLDGGTVVATGPLTVAGLTSLQGSTNSGQIDAGFLRVVNPGKICTDIPCSTNYLQNDGAGSLVVVGSFQGTGNWVTAGDNSGAYLKPASGLKNTGTGADCSSNTGAVCVNDTGGLAIADGSGNTVATISATGAAALASATLGGTDSHNLYRTGTVAVTGASVTAGACANQGSAITLTGAAAGDACFFGLSASPGNGLAYSCVTGSNSCQLVACNASAGNLTSLTGTHRCTVIH